MTLADLSKKGDCCNWCEYIFLQLVSAAELSLKFLMVHLVLPFARVLMESRLLILFISIIQHMTKSK